MFARKLRNLLLLDVGLPVNCLALTSSTVVLCWWIAVKASIGSPLRLFYRCFRDNFASCFLSRLHRHWPQFSRSGFLVSLNLTSWVYDRNHSQAWLAEIFAWQQHRWECPQLESSPCKLVLSPAQLQQQSIYTFILICCLFHCIISLHSPL